MNRPIWEAGMSRQEFQAAVREWNEPVTVITFDFPPLEVIEIDMDDFEA